MSTTTSTKTCYYSGCPEPPKWSVRTERSVQPNGQPFHLYTCDGHCEELTGECRRAGTRYLLRPIEVETEDSIWEADKPLSGFSRPVRVLAVICAGLLMIALTPPVVAYFLFKALFCGWRPPSDSEAS